MQSHAPSRENIALQNITTDVSYQRRDETCFFLRWELCVVALWSFRIIQPWSLQQDKELWLYEYNKGIQYGERVRFRLLP